MGGHKVSQEQNRSESILFTQIAAEMYDAEQILEEIHAQKVVSSGLGKSDAGETGLIQGQQDVAAAEKLTRERLLAVAPAERQPFVEAFLQAQVAQVLKVAPTHLNLQQPLTTLGLDSFMAIELGSRIKSSLGIVISPINFLSEYSLAQLSTQMLDQLMISADGQTGPDGSVRPWPLHPISRDETLPLSFAQERLWFLDQVVPNNPFYNVPSAIRIEGQLDVNVLEQSLDQIIERHEILRTTFVAVRGQPIQVVAPALHLTLPVVNLEEVAKIEQEAQVLRLATKAARQPFDLAHGPVLRMVLYRLGEQEHILLLIIHHIIFDSWSMGIFVREMATLYESHSTGKLAPLPELPVQYVDFAAWQQQPAQEDIWKSQSQYWQEKLAGLPAFHLPTDHPRPQTPSYRGHTQYLPLPPGLCEKLKTLSRREGVTPFVTLCAAFLTLLHQYSGQDDFAIGISVADRDQNKVKNLIGLFVNQVLIRPDFHPKPSFRDLLRQVQKEVHAAYNNKDLPFNRLVKNLQIERDKSRNPLFQLLLVHENTLEGAVITQGAMTYEIMPPRISTRTSRFDSMVCIWEHELDFLVSWEYSTDLFEDETIQLLLIAYRSLLDDCIRQPEQPIATFKLPEKLRQKVEGTRVHQNTGSLTKINHLSFACRNIEAGMQHVEELYGITSVSDIVFDALQEATLCLIETNSGLDFELVAGPQVESFLKHGVSLYHVCYEVADIFQTIEELRAKGAFLVSEPKPAKLFDDRLVAFLDTPLGLIELLETTKSTLPGKSAEPPSLSWRKHQPQTIAIAATFTAEPIEEWLTFWMQKLELPANIEFAPYNQVFQQLLDPSSLFSTNDYGVNIILIRAQDWQRFAVGPDDNQKIERNARDLIHALTSATERSAIPYLVCLCPASPDTLSDPERAAFFERLEQQLAAELEAMSGVYIVTPGELAEYYPVAECYDVHADRIGHIPYSQDFYTALGTMLARRIYGIQSKPCKVIALDCDQTLWKGVCGEDGPLGVEIDPPRQALQEFMVAQHDAGMLICLCSKNNEEDVMAVFERHPEMVLKREHVVSWRINWQSKSENLQSLAGELKLGLDSFIFLDDNPVECAEVQAHCPDVLTLQLPLETDSIPHFLKHVWAFDHLKITEADEQRTAFYRQNIERKHFRETSSSLEDFLAGLELDVQFSKLEPSHLERVAQLTQRTNQFNTTTIRRSANEIQALCLSEKKEGLVVEVRDRFGDYGLVGVIILEARSDTIDVDTFLLSCRALGKGVEQRMLARLGEKARERKLDYVDVRYVPTPKNRPAFDFLDDIGQQFKCPLENGFLFRFPAKYVVALASNSRLGDFTI
jgi:FkbH-like protein